MTDRVRAWRDHLARGYFPLPHPSWRTGVWERAQPLVRDRRVAGVAGGSGTGAGVTDWLAWNRANWDERVPVHLARDPHGPLRAGRGDLTPLEDAELGPVDGLRVLHLQCHIGTDTLALARRGAVVTGIDFSPPRLGRRVRHRR